MNLYRLYFKAIVSSLVLLISDTLVGQSIPDSLVNKLNHPQNDSVKARALLDIGESIEETTPGKSLGYYNQALSLSKQINNNRLILSSYNDVGVCYIELNKMDSAILAFEQAVTIATLLKDTIRTAAVIANIGNVHLHQNDHIKAIQFYLQSARLLESCGDLTRLPTLYSNICSLLNDQGEYDKSLEYGNKAISLAQKTGNTVAEAFALINLSNTYSDIKQPEKQFQLLEKALPLTIKNEDLDQIATVYQSMGAYYYEKNDYSSSLEKYLESYKYVQQMGNMYHLCTSASVLARVYNKLNQKNNALKFILQAEKLAIEVGARADLKIIYLTRAEIEANAGNYKLSSEYYSKTLTISDSLFNAATSEKVAEVEARYQNEKKQKEIVQLEKDKQIQILSLKEKSKLNYILTGSVGALLIVGLLGYRNFRNRQQLLKQQDELQQQRISELEKDRQLVAVDSMLKGQEDERSRLAKDLHDGLGGLLSGVKFSLSNMKENLVITPENMTVFERSLDMIDTSIMELRRVAHNMMPEMLMKFGLDEALKEYCNTINTTKLVIIRYQAMGMDKRLDKSEEIIIYRIVQELLNNILKHASASEAFVQLIRENNRLNIVVEDNGKGFDTANLEKGKGAGWVNIRSRVDYLKGQLDIHSEPGKGTLVNIEFNV